MHALSLLFLVLTLMAIVKVSSIPLTVTAVVELLQNPPQDRVINLPPVRPKAGDVYIYSPGDEAAKKCIKLSIG